jgi:UrcA family protein
MKESKLFKSLVATFVVIVLSGPAVVLADTPSYIDFVEGPKTTVSYADLNLANEESVRVLYRRLKRASKEACGGGSLRHSRSIIMKSSRLQCYRETLSNAVDKIDNENLTRIHAG